MKNTKDFSKAQIYCIRNSDTDDIYIGSSCQSLSQRMAQHRLDKRRANQQNRFLYKLMNEIDESKFYIELLEEYPCENVNQLRKRQGELIRELKPSLNMKIDRRTDREYYEDNKETILAKNKIYNDKHREYFNDWKKQYHEDHKEEVHKRQKEYRELKKETINQRGRKHYEENKDIINERRRQQYQLNKEKIQQRRKELKQSKIENK